MRHAHLVLILTLTATLVLWNVTGPGTAQGIPGMLHILTDYELIGTSELNGGGHVTWTLTGEEAEELRAKVVGLFDEYPQMPRGFTFGNATTGATPNGNIDRGEALLYTAYLENELEGVRRGFSGTRVGNFVIERADLLDTSAVERSTSGFVGTDANDTTDLQIRFVFNARTSSPGTDVMLASRAFADALHNVFSYNAVQVLPDPWPLRAEGGWRLQAVGNTTALWHGNTATGRYDNGSSNATRTEELYLSRPGLDFRFATSVRLDFMVRGQVADANDVLRLEAAVGPSFSNWNQLRAINATPPGAWRNESFDLSQFLGPQGPRVRFRFNFTSDGSGNAEGFFLRDVAIRAPSRYEGIVADSTAHYLIGILSHSDLAVRSGSVNVLRTPGGEILWYGSMWPTAAQPDDRLRFELFNAMENPQVLFAVMLAASYFISRSQEDAYDRYREALAPAVRPSLRRTSWLHIAGKATMAVLILLYFLPTAFFNIGLRVFVSGLAYWVLAVTAAIVLGLGTRMYYDRKAPLAPATTAGVPETMKTIEPLQNPKEQETSKEATAKSAASCAHCLREIPENERTYRCTCGLTYHLACAAGLKACSNCHTPIIVEVVPKVRSASTRCESCGEVQSFPEGVDPRIVRCESCGGSLRRLEEGRRYLLIVSDPGIAFMWVQNLAKGDRPGVVLTSAPPEKLRLEYGLKGVDVVQVQAGTAKGIDPRRLDPDGLRAILALSRSEKGGVLLYDGLDQMIGKATLGEVLKFLSKANDMAFVHKITVVARVTPRSLPEAEVRRLAAEFDESIDLADGP